ncbi:2TM domain-containing protein [Streptomyces sp. NPDC051913]|uniref:2TM domain-containing protein n=1 Tax=Streptomyces sp. NPDC051913 TaxID=3365676 RepID=UPI0037D44C87
MHKTEKAMRWGLRIHLLWYVVANAAQVVLWAILTPDHFFWPVWSIVGWGIGLAIHAWAIRSKYRSPVRP